MSFEMWSAFTAVSVVLLQIPSSTTLLVVSCALSLGPQTILATATGSALGDFTAMSISTLGPDALLTSSPLLFTALEPVSAARLVHLDLRLWCGTHMVDVQPRLGHAPSIQILAETLLVAGLNPKANCFFRAILPTFIEPSTAIPSQRSASSTRWPPHCQRASALQPLCLQRH